MAENVSQLYPTLAFNSKKKEYLLVWVSGKEIIATRINTNAFPKDRDAEFGLITTSPLAKVSEPMRMWLAYCQKYDEYLLIWPDKVTKPGDYSKESASKTFNLQALVLEGDDAGTKVTFMVGEKEGTAQPESVPAFESAIAEMFSQHDQMAPTAAYCPIEDEYLIVWCDQEKGAQKHLYGLRIRADDKKPVDTAPIRLVKEDTNQESPSLVWSEKQGEYLVVWGDDRKGLDIFGERISREGKPHGAGSFEIVPEPWENSRNQTEPSLAYNLADGSHAVVWADWTEEGQASLRGRRLNENGFPATAFSPGTVVAPVISPRLSDKRCPTVGADLRSIFRRQQSDYVVLWADDQNHPGTFEIWGHRLNENAFPFSMSNFVVVRADVEAEPVEPPGSTDVPEEPMIMERASLTSGPGMAGYVVRDFPDRPYLDGYVFAGYNRMYGQYYGVMQFDLSSIPAGSRIFSVELEMRGGTTKWLKSPGGSWSVKMLHPAIDEGWTSHTYDIIRTAGVAYTLAPACERRQLGKNMINRFTLGQNALSNLEKRLPRGVVSFRVDGPTGYPNLFVWDKPVLKITYGKPVEEEAPEKPVAPGLININTASVAELDTLPGIGPSLAQRIVERRPFARIEDIMNVSGIGQMTFDSIKDLITV